MAENRYTDNQLLSVDIREGPDSGHKTGIRALIMTTASKIKFWLYKESRFKCQESIPNEEN